MEIVRASIYAIEAYFAIGACVGIAFVTRGVSAIDASARGSSIAFRLLILPGSAAFWPLVLVKWIRR
jgi:hypothetical protein